MIANCLVKEKDTIYIKHEKEHHTVGIAGAQGSQTKLNWDSHFILSITLMFIKCWNLLVIRYSYWEKKIDEIG